PRHRADRDRDDRRALGDAERGGDRLSGDDPAQHPALRGGQAAAGAPGSGRADAAPVAALAVGAAGPRKAATISARCALTICSSNAASATSRPKKKTIESR